MATDGSQAPAGAARGPGQPVLGVDGRAEVGADGAHATAVAAAARPISSLRTHILAYRPRPGASARLTSR